jgi:DNA-binding transcriptional MocR family regulator
MTIVVGRVAYRKPLLRSATQWDPRRNRHHSSSILVGPGHRVGWHVSPAVARDVEAIQRALRLPSRSAAARLAVQVLARQVRRGRQFHLVEEDWPS